MKLFIKEISIFVAILIIPTLLCNIYIEKRTKELMTLRPECRIVAMGHSHLRWSVNDEQFPIFENCASSAESYYHVYHKLKKLVELNQNINAVCLTFCVNNYNKHIDEYFISKDKNHWIEDYMPIYRNYSHLPTLFNMPIGYSEYLFLIRVYMYPYNFKPLFSDSDNAYKGFFEKSTHKLNVENIDYLNAVTEKITNIESLDSYVSTVQIDILQLIAEYTKSNKIQLFLVNPPLHSTYTERIPQVLSIFHKEMAQKLHDECGTIYLDYHTMDLPDSCFKDHNHLNIHGAKIFTPQLLEDVTDNMERLGRW